MRFVLDDGPWAPADVAAEVLEDGLEALSDRLSVARERGEPVALYEGVWGLAVVGDETLDSLLFNTDSPRKLRRDARIRLARQLEQIAGASFDEGTLPDVSATVAGSEVLSPATVYAWAAVKDGRACACLTPPCSARAGATTVRVGEEELPVHFVPSEAHHVAFFRDAICLENADEDAFAQLAPSAFPELEFVDGVWRDLRDLSRPYRDRRDELIHHFGVLSDHGARIFALGQNALIEAEFGSLKVHLSPENTETLADGKCRRARERVHRGKSYLFDWHLKIEAHTDRIHVHPGDGGPVLVGIIATHLPLPGD